MRRRLVISTLVVVIVVMIVLLLPVFVVVSDAADDEERARLFSRLAIIAVFALGSAAALAAIQARQLARPLERLARSAGRIGDGDFTAPAASSGIREIDDISRSLRLSANRVDRMLASERGFTADATHQLRTGLTGLAIRLELLERHGDTDVADEARAILDQTHELNATLDELLAVARSGASGERDDIDLVEFVDHHVDDWRMRFERRHRQIVVTTGSTAPVRATPGLVGQIVNILIENSLNHGAGTLAVLVAGTSVTVEDQGSGIPGPKVATLFERPVDHHAPHGRGLALARRLAESDGGRLELVAASTAQFRLTYTSADAASPTSTTSTASTTATVAVESTPENQRSPGADPGASTEGMS